MADMFGPTRQTLDLAQRFGDELAVQLDDALNQAIKKARFQEAFDELIAPGQKAARDLAKAINGAGGLTQGVSGLGGALAIFGPEAAAAGLVVNSATSAFSQLANTVTRLVAVSNPAQVERYTRAWDDLQGVMGQLLEPTVELMTDSLRFMADLLADNSEGVQILVNTMVDLGRMALEAAQRLAKLAASISIFGQPLLNYKPGSSVGAAARQTSYEGLESFGDRVRQQAFRGGRTPDQQRDQMIRLLGNIDQKTGRHPDPAGSRKAIGGDDKGQGFAGGGANF